MGAMSVHTEAAAALISLHNAKLEADEAVAAAQAEDEQETGA
jgi:hypothetical protein